jgi:hypothetical protein
MGFPEILTQGNSAQMELLGQVVTYTRGSTEISIRAIPEAQRELDDWQEGVSSFVESRIWHVLKTDLEDASLDPPKAYDTITDASGTVWTVKDRTENAEMYELMCERNIRPMP